MSGLFFLGALLLLPVLGWCATPLLFWHARSRRGGLAVLSGLGMVALTLTMLLQPWVRVPWTIVGLIAPFFLVRIVLAWRREPEGAGAIGRSRIGDSGPRRRRARAHPLRVRRRFRPFHERRPSAFWGPKGQHFAQAAGVDPAYLTSRSQFVLRPDYPPLVPFFYAWGTLFAGRLPWNAAVLTLPLCVLLSALGFWSAARGAIPARQAAEGTMFLVPLLGSLWRRRCARATGSRRCCSSKSSRWAR